MNFICKLVHILGKFLNHTLPLITGYLAYIGKEVDVNCI